MVFKDFICRRTNYVAQIAAICQSYSHHNRRCEDSSPHCSGIAPFRSESLYSYSVALNPGVFLALYGEPVSSNDFFVFLEFTVMCRLLTGTAFLFSNMTPRICVTSHGEQE